MKNEYLLAYDQYGLHSEWQPMGTWTVPSGQQYSLTAAVSPSGGGSISPASGWYNSGMVVQISASTNAGYQFTGFSGDLSGSANPQNLTMNAAKNVTAVFTAASDPPRFAGGETVQTQPDTVTWTVYGYGPGCAGYTATATGRSYPVIRLNGNEVRTWAETTLSGSGRYLNYASVSANLYRVWLLWNDGSGAGV